MSDAIKIKRTCVRVDYEKVCEKIISKAPELKDYVETIKSYPAPKYGEQSELLEKIKQGDKRARQRIIEIYMRYILHVGLSYSEQLNLPIDDSIQTGMMCLVESLNLYVQRNYSMPFLLFLQKKIIDKFIVELPANTAVSYPKKIRKLLNYCRLNNINTNEFLLEHINEKDTSRVINGLRIPESYERLSGRDLFDNSFEDYVFQKEAYNILASILNTLTSKERDYLILKYGLLDGCERSAQAIGNIYRIKREPVRQVIYRSLMKLRHPSRSKILLDFDWY